MKLLLTTGILLFVLSLNAQERIGNNVKSLKVYSLKDTIGFDLKNSSSLEKFKWYTRNYDRSGRLTKEISYPFPHNPIHTKTKITDHSYLGDTIVTKVYTDESELASEKIVIHSTGKQEYGKAINYGIVGTSDFKDLDYTYIVITVHDSIANTSKAIQIMDRETHLDTFRIFEKELATNDATTIELAASQARNFTRIDSMKYANLLTYGSLETLSTDTLNVIYVQEVNLSDTSKMVQKLKIEKEYNRVTKSEVYWVNNRIHKKTDYKLSKGEWQVKTVSAMAYNRLGDIELLIRDDYRDGVFGYRFVTVTGYEYY